MVMKLFKVAKAAEDLTIKPSTVRSWILSRKISSIRVGRSVRIPENEIQRVLREGLRPAREPLEKRRKNE
jgi:excisionase family DNA binding protein